MLEEKLMNEFEQAVLRGERLGPGDITDEVCAIDRGRNIAT